MVIVKLFGYIRFLVPETETIENWANVDIYKGSNPSENAAIFLSDELFSSDVSDILYAAILISEVGCQEDPKPMKGYWDNTYEWPIMVSWSKENNMDCIIQYSTTPEFWNPRDQSVKTVYKNDIQYVIGTSSCTEDDEYCNGALRPGTKYAVIIRTFSARTYADSKPIFFATESSM